jgi:hypothetical protein
MKKIIIRLLLVVFILLIVAAFAAAFFLDAGIKRGVEYVGPRVTKVDVKLNSVSLSLFSGSGKIRDLVIGNPEGYKSPSAISVGSASLAVSPASILSDKIIVKSINVQAPEITYETTDIISSNLKKLMNNIEETTGGGSSKEAAPAKEPAPSKEPAPKEPAPKAPETSKAPAPSNEPTASAAPSKKLQVDDFVVNGAKLHITVNALGQNLTATTPLPQIHLSNLGAGPDGITAAELTKLVLKEILVVAEREGIKVGQDLLKGGQYFSSQAGTNTANTIKDATRGIGDLLKKK